MAKNMKRIHKVTIKRMVDESPDTSWLGEYSNTADSEYSIDRAHAQDCASLEENHGAAVDQLERILQYLNRIESNDDLADACDIIVELQDDAQECDCGGHGDMGRHEYRYFNPSRNYDGDTPENIRKYTRQDYERMERLNAGDWCFIGIRAEAEYSVGESRGGGRLCQTLSSGGLWGIESDSEQSYFASVADEKLADLAAQLKGIGFSGRAIAAAFKTVTTEEN